MIVLDASVAVKLYRDEVGSDLAHKIFHVHSGGIAAPGIFAVEVASVLVREANMLKDRASESARKLDTFARMIAGPTIQLKRFTPEDIRCGAMMAIELGHPLKDCLYVMLAMQLDCPLVTADARFAAKALVAWDKVQTLGE